MATKITHTVLESYLNCKYKGYRKLTGESGTISDYEAMTAAARQGSRELALAKLLARFGVEDACRGSTVTAATLKQGAPLLADAHLEGEGLSLRFDALKRANGTSQLGDYHYIPVLYHEDKVGQRQKLLLSVLGLILERVQGLRPAIGLIARGPEGRLGNVRLDARFYRQASQVLDEVKRLQQGGEAPRLTLNGHCQVCEFRQPCRAQAEQADDISLLGGVSEKELQRFHRKGLFTLTQLAYTFRPRRKGKRSVRRSNHRHYALQALAIRDRRVYLFGTPELPHSPTMIYVDVEGKPDEGFVYLIGMVVVREGQEERFSFWADDKEQEGDIVQQMLDELARHDDFAVFCYGSYERNFLKRVRKTSRKKRQVDRVLNALVNVLSLVHAHAYFPSYGNGLKEVAGCLGFSWSECDASGLQSIVWRERWERTRDELWKQKLTRYNLEDCAALRRVTDLLRGFGARGAASEGIAPIENCGLQVSEVGELDKWDNNRQWGRVSFVQPEFEQINQCAYFDYQRERVFVRSSPLIRRSRCARRRGRQKLPITQHVTLTSRKCPRCGATTLTTEFDRRDAHCPIPRAKRAYDLRVTAGGIRRKVIQCKTSVHRCLTCGHDFIPAAHERMDKHFHGLKSWAMYQHVAHDLGLEPIRIMISEFFGIRVHFCEIYMFKSLMARYYRATYCALLQRILSGHLLHIDETEVQLQDGKGYVWVFTNLEEVVYMFRPTREGDFLKKLLKDFHGVLVSDFYAAYDSLDCPQQKCLIHLIRDMNQELLNNPFDEELREITRPFGILLRAAIATIDEHGLKRRHLEKHVGETESFFRALAGRIFRSEAAEALRLRLLKYQGKLFTFLEQDDVPWNNNNAENAIKQFASYRENRVGMMKERGLSDYLVLLSLCQTCRYQGVSFLKFLLSGGRDIDAFGMRGRAKRRPAIEVYPKNFMPPHLARLRDRRAQQSSGSTEPVVEKGS